MKKISNIFVKHSSDCVVDTRETPPKSQLCVWLNIPQIQSEQTCWQKSVVRATQPQFVEIRQMLATSNSNGCQIDPSIRIQTKLIM